MDDLDLGPAYAEIGGLVLQDTDFPPQGAFFYCEIELGMLNTSIFVDVGEKLINHDASQKLIDKIYDLWLSIPKKKRWAAMSYTVTGDKFDASFQFPGEIDSKEFIHARRSRILKAKFGNKPVRFEQHDGSYLDVALD